MRTSDERGALLVALGTTLLVRAVGAQATPVPHSLTVELIGAAGQRRVLTASDLRGLRSVDVDVASHNVHGHYRGVPLGDLLRLLGSPAGDSLRGPALARDVIVEASDGYRVMFAPAEVDTAFVDKTVLLAFEKNGAPLDSTEGSFRMIAVGESVPLGGFVE